MFLQLKAEAVSALASLSKKEGLAFLGMCMATESGGKGRGRERITRTRGKKKDKKDCRESPKWS